MFVVGRPNRDALQKALDIYHDAMRSFIVRTLKAVPGKKAEDLIAAALRRNAHRFQQDMQEYDDLETSIDAGDIPEIINQCWSNPFIHEFQKNQDVRSMTRLIRAARNEVAHWRTKNDMDAEDTRARLTDIAKLLGLINAPDEQREVRKIRDQLIAAFTLGADPAEKPAKLGIPRPPAPTPEPTVALPPRPASSPPLRRTSASPAKPAGPRPLKPAMPRPTDAPQPQPDAAATPTATNQARISDNAALAALYHATSGQRWANNRNWLSDKPLAEWHGVATDSNGRVTDLDLSNNQLTGKIPTDLDQIRNLEILDLSGNDLSGEIPADLSRLSKLELLILTGNPLTGCIPHGLRDIPENDLLELGLPFCDAKASAPPEPTRAEGMRSRLDLSILNEQQRKAVTHVDGPLLIFAGPGTGKTRVITYRVAHLIESGVPPWSILAVTFTNKAAAEMRKRIKQLVGNSAGKVNVGTFHAQALYILRRNIQHLGRELDFTVYDAADQLHLIKQIVSQEKINTQPFSSQAICDAISRAKDELVNHDEFATRTNGDFEKTVARVYHSYQRRLEDANGVDFGDMLFLCWRIFREYPEVLAFYQDRFRYILVDEYQDINSAQYGFIRELAAIRGNVCVVGDDDQNIYSWRGASVRFIRDFETQFPDAAVVRLERNYRSTKEILACANAVISKLADRVPKGLWTEREDGLPPAIIEAHDEEDEAKQVTSLIRDLHGDGFAYGDIAITYRINAQSRPFESLFRRQGLPYRLVNARDFYNRPEVRDVVAYLRAATNVRDSLSFEQIAVRHCSLTAGHLQGFSQQAMQTGCAPGELARQLAPGQGGNPALRELGELLRRLDTLADELPVSQLIDAVIRESGYDKVLNNDPYRAEERWDNIRELKSAAAKYDELGPRQSLGRFLSETALLAHEVNANDGADAVTLLTAHASKGLEFGVVVVVGLEDGVFPGFRSFNDPEQSAGERRLAYVALTRAKDQLFLSHARRRSGRDTPNQFPSRFLRDIPEELLHYRRRISPPQSIESHQSLTSDASLIYSDNMPTVSADKPSLASTLISTMTDRSALVSLYQTTNGTSWANNRNWLSYAPLGQWHGVSTDDNGKVVKLNLIWNQLRGEIPSELGSLICLEELYLKGNYLTGKFPVELTRLKNLTHLHISMNHLSGWIPQELRDIADNDLSQLGLPFRDK